MIWAHADYASQEIQSIFEDQSESVEARLSALKGLLAEIQGKIGSLEALAERGGAG